MDWPLIIYGILVVYPTTTWLYLAWILGNTRDSIEELDAAARAETSRAVAGVSVIFAARDEEHVVEKAARSLFAQEFPNLTITAVDDRSRDRTGAILDTVALENPRLRVVHLVDLPEGILGKIHALREGAAVADADWLLFTDADVVFQPGVIRRVVGFAEHQKLDQLTIGPHMPIDSLGESVFMSMFLLLFGLYAPAASVSDPRSRAHVGVGAFNLVRRSAFEAVGGFREIALSVDDDMQLGRLLKYSGYRCRFLTGEGLISVKWHVGLWGMVRGLEKNFFAGARYNVLATIFVAILLILLSTGPHVGLFVGPVWVRVCAALGIVAIAYCLAKVATHLRIHPIHALLLPIGGFSAAYALIRSMVLTLKRGGVSWRDTFYPLARLREHVRNREKVMRTLWNSTQARVVSERARESGSIDDVDRRSQPLQRG